MFNWRQVITTIEEGTKFGDLGHCSLNAIRREINPRVNGTAHIETELSVFWSQAMSRYFFGCIEQSAFLEWTITLAIGGRVYAWCKFDYDHVEVIDECEVN